MAFSQSYVSKAYARRGVRPGRRSENGETSAPLAWSTGRALASDTVLLFDMAVCLPRRLVRRSGRIGVYGQQPVLRLP